MLFKTALSSVLLCAHCASARCSSVPAAQTVQAVARPGRTQKTGLPRRRLGEGGSNSRKSLISMIIPDNSRFVSTPSRAPPRAAFTRAVASNRKQSQLTAWWAWKRWATPAPVLPPAVGDAVHHNESSAPPLFRPRPARPQWRQIVQAP
jgi:hypothetical protein